MAPVHLLCGVGEPRRRLHGQQAVRHDLADGRHAPSLTPARAQELRVRIDSLVNLIREFLGRPRQVETRDSGSAAPNQSQVSEWSSPRAGGCARSGRRPSWRPPARRGRSRVAVEHDEVGVVARDQRAAPALVARQPRGRHARRVKRLLDRQRLLGMPRRAVVDRAADAGANPGEWVEAPESARRCRSRQRPPSRGAGRTCVRTVSLPAQKASARSRSEGACENCTEHATPSSAKRPTSSGASSCACSIRWRSPSGPQRSRVCSNASSASRFARSPIASHATGNLAAAPRRTISASCVAARDLHAAPVEHPRGLRAERPVHEHLQVAELQVGAAEARAQPHRHRRVERGVRDRLPHAQRQVAARLELLPQAQRARASRPCRARR